MDSFQELQNRFGRFRIQGTRRFIAQENRWIRCQCAGNTDTLFLAARKLSRIGIGFICQIDVFQKFHDLFMHRVFIYFIKA